MDVPSEDPSLTSGPTSSNETPASPRDEIAAFLAADETRLGDVYRGIVAGQDAEQIARDLEVQTSNFVWNYSRIIEALLDRNLPTAPVVARQVASRYRSMLKSAGWSNETRHRLEADLSLVEAVAADVDARAAEVAEAQQHTKAVESSGESGIYVYALPHYLRYPYDPDSGRTLMKVGRSDRDVMQRMRDQARTTALPEEPVLLRVYPPGEVDIVATESKFHKTLRAFDHGRAAQRMAGREWFLTTTSALDAIADLLGLNIRVVSDVADYLEEG